MTNKAVEERFNLGTVEYVCYDYSLIRWLGRLIYVAIGVWALWYAWQGPDYISLQKVPLYLALFFAILRLLLQDEARVYICAGGLVFRRQVPITKSLASLLNPQEHYIGIPYDYLIGFNIVWSQVQCNTDDGGIVVVPIEAKALSRSDKKRIIRRVKQSRENRDD